MKNQLFEDFIESIKELPTEVLEEMRVNMNEEQMRKDFEKWQVEEGYTDPMYFGEDWFKNGQYILNDVNNDWKIWKASRESLVVELPYEVWTDYDDNGHYDYGYRTCLSDIKESLESQGIKWK